MSTLPNAESHRLEEDAQRRKNWTRWGPYLAERQWGTVREDYSADGQCWDYLSHDHARSRAYRWGEDGLLGITDRECRMCFALALWNGQDPILKERLFGLTGPEGNHGEDVKELYYYLDATPTSSYLKAQYKYPQAAFPYQALVEGNRRRGRGDPELELEDLGVFDDGRYWDVVAEYAKHGPNDVLIRLTVHNRGPEAATLHLLPNLWLRNTWSWGRTGEGYWPEGHITSAGEQLIVEHASLGKFRLACEGAPRLMFTDNETNHARLFGVSGGRPYTKDAFHRVVIAGEEAAINPAGFGTKACAWYQLEVPAGGQRTVRLRLFSESEAPATCFDEAFDATFAHRIFEADEFHHDRRNAPMDAEERRVVRQCDAGLLWSKQFYHYVVEHWLDGDPGQPPPPAARKTGRNRHWRHIYARDLISMPDKWEYPWFAAWDTAFHCVAMARLDPTTAKRQLLLLCREWYMHANGQLPAYEFAFGDVNPPVHAWAAWRVYQLDSVRGGGDRAFLEAAFHKCLVNFTWWVNREDDEGDNLFSGGFLGLDNVGIFDRSQPLPAGGRLEQADATAWMASYCSTMLAMALELAKHSPGYADIASKFFEHYVAIAEAMNTLGGSGLWNEENGFYYDLALFEKHSQPMRIRSMVGLIPLIAVQSLDDHALTRLPMFRERLEWFLEHKPELTSNIAFLHRDEAAERRLLAITSRDRLLRVLRYVLDENEFLSPYGVRSLSKAHGAHPFSLALDGHTYEVHYAPGESDSGLFGGNSNWRGPVWFPVNYLLIEALKRYHHFYRNTLTVECPTGSGRFMNLLEVAQELERRLARLFMPDATGQRPCHGAQPLYARDPHFRDLVLFHEYFHGDDGRGLGASHQTGWTALAANLIERVAEVRAAGRAR
jgi:hypothetical protein